MLNGLNQVVDSKTEQAPNESLYFTLLVDVKENDATKYKSIFDTIKNYISDFDNVPLTAYYYVIKCQDPKERNLLYNKLEGLSEDVKNEFTFFLSPLYHHGGKFVGRADSHTWTELNSITRSS